MLFVESPFLLALSAAVAVLLDQLWGEPRRWHPLVGFGNWANWIENRLNNQTRLAGGVALLLALSVTLVVALLLAQLNDLFWWLAATLLMYLALGKRSLAEHGDAVRQALDDNDLPLARERVGYIVSRQTEGIDSAQVTKATLESLLENGSDAVFAPLFWYLLLGPIAVVFYRLANTLDAMWGYRTPKFAQFGWAAAKLDDVLNWLPARLCAWGYILAAGFNPAHIRHCRQLWRQQAPLYDSPNGGPVMASGASALNVSLGGGALYSGVWKERPLLGCGPEPQASDITRSIQLINRSAYGWLLSGFFLGLISSLVTSV